MARGKGEGAQEWDLLVIGGGSAGIVGAKTAARLGARVALVERDKTGGDCLWRGCVPSKSLLASAHAAAAAGRLSAAGVYPQPPRIDFPAIRTDIARKIAHIEPIDSPQALEDAGVHVISGQARFSSRRTITVEDRTIAFRHALLATGARPAVPSIPGLSESSYLTSDSLWDLAELPERLVVLGGGSIGCELGQAFARLGSSVVIVDSAPHILPREHADAAAVVAESLTADGVRVAAGVAVQEVFSSAGDAGFLRISTASVSEDIPFDRLLVAVGRTPNTAHLGLDTAGVRLGERGFVEVSASLRTSNPRIWAAGDLTGHPQFTHTAGSHGSLAASNAVLGLSRKAQTDAIPRITFTDPEVASVGVSGVSADGATTITRTHDHVDRAVTDGRVDGFSELTLDRKGRILGATIVGPRAGESLAEVVVAMKSGMTVRGLAGVMHAYPSYGDGVWAAAVQQASTALETPAARRFTRLLRRWSRWKSSLTSSRDM